MIDANELDGMPFNRGLEVGQCLLAATEQQKGLAKQKARSCSMIEVRFQNLGSGFKQAGFAAGGPAPLNCLGQSKVAGGVSDGSKTTKVFNISGKVGRGEIQHAQELGRRGKRWLCLLEIP